MLQLLLCMFLRATSTPCTLGIVHKHKRCTWRDESYLINSINFNVMFNTGAGQRGRGHSISLV